MPNNPLISVIIPVYNGENFLAEALDSVFSQCYRPLQVIVVDDGSTDHTAKICQHYNDQLLYYYQNHHNAPSARNQGLKLAKGELIAFLDADDLWAKDKLSIQTHYLALHPQAEIILGRIQKFFNTTVDDRKLLAPTASMHLGCGLFRRSVFNKVGVFSEDLAYSDDWDWFMRAKELNVAIMTHQEVVQYHRRHQNNITNQQATDFHYRMEMLRRSLQRRRKKSKNEGGNAMTLPQLNDFARCEK